MGLTFSVALMAGDIFPITLTTADGLPGRFTGDSNEYSTRYFEFDEPVSSFRFTVISTNTTDTLTEYEYDGLSAGYGPGFPFFTMSEFRVYDADDNLVELSESMLSSNAIATNDGGGLAALIDGSTGTFYHGTYSWGTLPQAYHYLEVTLPQPMSKFKLRWFSRSNRKNMPTTVGITAGGTEYLPYPEYGFELGEKVTSLEQLAEGGVFVLKGSYYTYDYDDSNFGREEPYRGDAYYHSPYGAAITPSAADIITFVPTGEENTYYIHWPINGHYVYNPAGRVEGSEYAQWVSSSFKAGKYTFSECDSVPGSFIVKCGDLLLGQRRFIKMAIVHPDAFEDDAEYTYHYAWNVYKAKVANVKGTAIEKGLEKVINVADSLIALQGLLEDEDEGEYETLKAAVAEGRSIITANEISADEAIKKTNEIDLLTAQYRKQYLYVLIDSIEYILNDANLNFTNGNGGWSVGSYPDTYQIKLTTLADEANIAIDNITALVDISVMIDELTEGLKNLYASRVEKVYALPMRFTEKDGLPGVREDGNVNKSYIWDTPLLYLNEATDVIRITVTKESSNAIFSGSGTAFYCLGELEFYDAAGDLIPIREDMIEVNSLNATDGGGIAALVDGNHATWYHSAYGSDQDIVPGVGEYAYIQVTFDEPLSVFRYRMVSRANNTYNRAPVDFGITNGSTYDPDDVPVQDPFNLKVVEKVTDVSQIVDGGYYILYGNLSKFDADGEEVVGNGSGYYEGLNVYASKKPHSCCLFTFENAGDGKFYLHSLSKDYYVEQPKSWSNVNATYFKKDAAAITIKEHATHADMFNMYSVGVVEDENSDLNGEQANFLIQDWGESMGACPIADLENDLFEFDGQSEWEIYKVTVDNFGIMWLQSVLGAVEASGFTSDIFGINPGQYNGAGVDEFKSALVAAQALADTKDAAAAKAAADALQSNIEALSTVTVNPIKAGAEYYIVSTYDMFYQLQGKEMAIFADKNDKADPNIVSENQPYWGTFLDEANGTKEAYTWIFEQGDTTLLDEVEEGTTYVYLKNKQTGDYMGTWDNWSVRLPMSKEPLLYYIKKFSGIKYNIGSYDAHLNFASNNDTYPFLHILGHDDGKTNWGHLCFWQYAAEQSKWKLIYANTTSINNDVVDDVEGEVVSTTYYTTDGKVLSAPVQGVNIIKKVYANGAVKVVKAIIK